MIEMLGKIKHHEEHPPEPVALLESNNQHSKDISKLKRVSAAPPGPTVASPIHISDSSYRRRFTKKMIAQDVLRKTRVHEELAFMVTSTVESKKNRNVEVKKMKRKVTAHPDDITRLKKVKGSSDGDGRGRKSVESVRIEVWHLKKHKAVKRLGMKIEPKDWKTQNVIPLYSYKSHAPLPGHKEYKLSPRGVLI